MDHLLELATLKEMRKALQSYPAHLDQAFESSLERIDAQSKSHSSLAYRVMGWITSAERRLSMAELIHGLATEEGIDVIDNENLLAPKTVLKVCGGLVAANSHDGTVNMVHITVYDWFRNRDNARFHEDMARSCLRYLTLLPLSVGPTSSPVEMEQRTKSLPFLPYAAVHWSSHVIDDAMESKLTNPINMLLDNINFRSAAFQASNYKNHVKDLAIKSATFKTMPTGHSVLHIAACWNLPQKVLALVADGEDLDAVDSQSWTPLHWACFRGSQNAMAGLIYHGAGLDVKDSVGWTPLFWAALNGDTTMVELLLKNGANYLERDIHGWTALRWAAAGQQTDVISILLRHHSDNISAFRNSPRSSLKRLSLREALRYITEKDTQSDLLDDLQDTGSEPGQDGKHFIDLYSILRNKSFDISQLWNSGHFDPPVGNVWRTMNKAERLHGVDNYITRDSYSSTSSTEWTTRLLHAAIRDDKLLAVRLLIELGANVNGKMNRARTPLHAATFRTNPAYAELLLEKGANIDAVDYQCLTPLQQAVINGFEKTIELLLAKGAKVDAIWRDVIEVSGLSARIWHDEEAASATRTPLMLACGLATTPEDPTLPARIVRLLLESGADVNIKDAGKGGMTAVHYAARSRNPHILELVINGGVDNKMLDEFGRTAVHHLVLGLDDTRIVARSFDHQGNYPPGMATDCLTLLSQRCETDYLSQAAEWEQSYEVSRNSWTSRRSIHTPLSLAIVVGDWEVFQALHCVGARFDTNGPLGYSLVGPLRALQPAAVDMLVEAGATFRSNNTSWDRDLYILNPLHEIRSEEIERLTAILAKLIPQGLDINAAGWDEETLLHKVASRRGSSEIAKALMGIGANPCRRNGDGLDSFVLASLGRNFDTLRCLLGHAKKHPAENHWTQYLDHSETVHDVNVPVQICIAIEKAGLINSGHKSGTLLCRAADSGSDDFIQALLKHGADASIGDEKGRRPLHFAAKQGHAAVVERLAHWRVDMDACDKDQRTPLHLSALEGRPEAVELLLSSGASPNKSDAQGWQPLHFAAWVGHAEIVRSLIESGASVNAATSHYTSEGDRRGPSGPSIRGNWTGTPLHLAAMAGSSEIVRLLLTSQDTDVNARTDNYEQTSRYNSVPTRPRGGPTALHIALDANYSSRRCGSALNRGKLEIASMLVEAGADVRGVVDHLRLEDLQRFEDFPELWDKLRVGISE